MYPIVTSSGCPEKSFLANTTLGVSHYETYRPRFRRRPRPHRCSRLHADLFRVHPEQSHRSPRQRSPSPDMCSRRSERLRYGSWPVSQDIGIPTKNTNFLQLRNNHIKRGPVHEKHRPRFRCRPRPHRCSCLHADLIRLHPKQVDGGPCQRSPSPHVRSRRSQRLRYGSRSVIFPTDHVTL